MAQTPRTRARSLRAIGAGTLGGLATVLALTVNVPLASALPIAAVVWWSARTGRPLTGSAGFFLGLGFGLGGAAFVGSQRCNALNMTGAYCAGPDLVTVGFIAGLPMLLSVPFTLLGWIRRR